MPARLLVVCGACHQQGYLHQEQQLQRQLAGKIPTAPSQWRWRRQQQVLQEKGQCLPAGAAPLVATVLESFGRRSSWPAGCALSATCLSERMGR